MKKSNLIVIIVIAIVVLLGRQEAEKDAIMAPVAALQDHHEA